jgi:hypothetical protein
MIKTFYLMGITCTGKDYFIERAMQRHPTLFGCVQVGKEFRRRYTASHFQGSAAPDHTEREAIEIFEEQHEQAVKDGFKYILVSGQPRRLSQIEPCLTFSKGGTIIFMRTPHETILERLSIRFENDKEGYDLSMQRLVNDKIQLYDVIFELLDRQIEFRTLDTDKRGIDEAIDTLAHFGDF